MYHKPVLLAESVDALVNNPDGVYVDVTFGGGGHSREILSRLSEKGRLFSFDQDSDALNNAIEDPRFTLINQNFRFLENSLLMYGVTQVDGVLGDLGVSSHQFDKAERGFSIRSDAPLDMRMNNMQSLDAQSVVNDYEEELLADIFYYYGELREARKLAREIVRYRKETRIVTTEDLKKVLNVIEFVKFIISHYKLAKKTDNIFSYKYNQIDAIMNECLQSDLASLKNINSPDIDVARKKIIEYSNNPLSFFHYNFQGEEIKIINTERFNFKVYNLFLLNSINYEKLRELFQITKLEFDKNGNTVLGMILSKDLIFETEDKKELDRSKLEYLILDNSLDIYKYPNNNSKEYLKVLNFKEENPNNYLAVTEFIKANKTVYNLEIFIKLNIKEI